MNKSNRKMCEEYKLDWNQGLFKILEVTLTPEVFDTWHQNTTYILKSRKYYKNLVRKETFITRDNNCYKSNSHCKVYSPFLTLPNPPGNLVKTLNKLFYKFILNSGPGRIKRQYIIKILLKGSEND